MPRTRSVTRAEKARVPDSAASTTVDMHGDVLCLILTHVGEHEGGDALTRCEAVCVAWCEASKDKLLEPLWRKLCMRMSPAAPSVDAKIDADEYVCTAFTNPTVQGVLARGENPSVKLSFRLLFQRRMRAALAAQAAYRELGTYPDLDAESPLVCCTTPAAEPSSFKYEDLSFTFELFQSDYERQNRVQFNNDSEFSDCDDDDEEERQPYVDYLSPAVLSGYAAPPHYVNSRAKHNENLIWCSTVRGEQEGARAKAPRDLMGRVARRTSVGIDTGMDDYFCEWARSYRMVVTATRDTDGKMCQIVDVVCRDGGGFKEIGGDSMTGGVTVMVVPDDEAEDAEQDGKEEDAEEDDSDESSDQPEDHGLAVWCFFGGNNYGKRIGAQLEEPGRNKEVDKAWNGMMKAAYESLGALFELSITWNMDPQEVATALGTLQWY